MKYLLLIGLVLVVWWFLRNSRRPNVGEASRPTARNQPHAPGVTTEIVACDVCQVHLPRSEALTGPGGVYCSAEHRKQAGG